MFEIRPMTDDEIKNAGDHECVNRLNGQVLIAVESLLTTAVKSLAFARDTSSRYTRRLGAAIVFKKTMGMLTLLGNLAPGDDITWNLIMSAKYDELRRDGAFYLRDEFPKPGYNLLARQNLDETIVLDPPV